MLTELVRGRPGQPVAREVVVRPALRRGAHLCQAHGLLLLGELVDVDAVPLAHLGRHDTCGAVDVGGLAAPCGRGLPHDRVTGWTLNDAGYYDASEGR